VHGVSLFVAVLTWILALAPGGASRPRYIEIARAIADASDADPVFEGEDGAARTAAYLTSIAWHESAFSPDAVGLLGELGLWQIHPNHGIAASILRDPRRAAPIAIEEIRRSVRACDALPERHRLALYASGDCRRGRRESEHRVRLANELASN
jgi:hypothetical protein